MFNKSSNLYNGEWLALVFANRNQSYGAYQLRLQASSTLIKALFFTAPLFIGIFLVPSLVAALRGDVVIDNQQITGVEFRDVIHELKPEQAQKAEPAPAEEKVPQKVVTPKVKSVALTDNIKVVNDDLVTHQPPTTLDLKDAVVANVTQDGAASKGGNEDVAVAAGGDGLGAVNSGNSNEILNTAVVDHSPEFPGGMEAWSKYIQKNLRYPSIAQEEGVQGKVFLSFVVEKDGSITDVKVIKGIGYGCDDEAARVIKKSPRWKAGMQNNLPVRVRYNMPISYMMSN